MTWLKQASLNLEPNAKATNRGDQKPRSWVSSDLDEAWAFSLREHEGLELYNETVWSLKLRLVRGTSSAEAFGFGHTVGCKIKMPEHLRATLLVRAESRSLVCAIS